MSRAELRQKFRTHIAVGIEKFKDGVAMAKAPETIDGARRHIEMAREQFRESKDEHAGKWFKLAEDWLRWLEHRSGDPPKDSPHSHWMRGIWSLNSAMSSASLGDPDGQVEFLERARDHFALSKHPDASRKVKLCVELLLKLREGH